MRLPLNDDKNHIIDTQKTKEMIDYFMKKGYNYFDTAHIYHGKNSEKIVKELISDCYPRDSFVLTTKLPIFNLEKEEDMQLIFEEQLAKCGVEYFDYYLLHNVSSKHRAKFTEIDSFSFVKRMKDEGKIKHIGISCHDTPEFLEKVLVDHPEIEVVQLQINYLDWNDSVIQSGKCYDVACKYDKKVIVMEGLKGGSLVNLDDKSSKILSEYDDSISLVEWSFRFNLSLDNILVVLSGMNTIHEVKENIEICENFRALNDDERKLLDKVARNIHENIKVGCTGCNYCIDYCPQNIQIPEFFKLYNCQNMISQHSLGVYYRNLVSLENISPQDCTECNSCVSYCPQNIIIPETLKKVKESFE